MRPASLLRFATAFALAATVGAGCNSSKNAASVEGSPMPPSNLPPAPMPAAPPAAAAPHPSTTGMGADPAAAAGPVPTLRGRLAEKVDTKDYTYLRITTAAGDAWAAVPTANVAVGSDVTVAGQMVMDNFQSKTLNRTFDKLVFGTLEGGAAAGAPAAGANPHAGMGGMGAAGAAAQPPSGSPHSTVPDGIGDLKVAKAEGAEGRTVAEVFAQKAALANKSVSVRGKVVKYTGGVMGKNWVHVRDASGSDAAGDNDLTATTADEAKVGDVVVIKGTVHVDRDFGAGYKYAVIVEDAKLGK